MTHASVFSGIGGPEIAAAMLGWENLFHCEINEFGRKVLDYWFPNSKSYEDITKTDFSEWRGRVNVLTGGFPCQPFSYAGKRRGADDDRYLWPYMFRCIDQIRPDWVVAENVAGITTMVEQGEVSEMGGQASMFEEVDDIHRYRLDETFTLPRICDDLESHGYTVQPVLIPACTVGAPHRRDRVFIVARRIASDTDFGADRRIAGENEGKGEEERIQERHEVREPDESDKVRPEMRNFASDTCSYGCCIDERKARGKRQNSKNEERHKEIKPKRFGLQREPRATGCRELAADTPNNGLQHNVWRGREDGIPVKIQPTPADGRGRTSSDSDNERLEGYGREKLQGYKGREDSNEHPAGHCCDNSAERTDADTDCDGLQGRIFTGAYNQQGWNRPLKSSAFYTDSLGSLRAGCGRWDSFPTVSPVHRGNDGIPFDVDRLSISFSKWRTESLKAYGNAIVPQVIYEIFRFIEIVEKGGEE